MQGDGGEEGARNGGIGDGGDEKRAKKGGQFGSEVRGKRGSKGEVGEEVRKENHRVLRLREERGAGEGGRERSDEVEDGDASGGRGGGGLGEEAGDGEQGVDVGAGEARRGGRRAAGADPGELVGQEGGVLGDEVAELGESLH